MGEEGAKTHVICNDTEIHHANGHGAKHRVVVSREELCDRRLKKDITARMLLAEQINGKTKEHQETREERDKWKERKVYGRRGDDRGDNTQSNGERGTPGETDPAFVLSFTLGAAVTHDEHGGSYHGLGMEHRGLRKHSSVLGGGGGGVGGPLSMLMLMLLLLLLFVLSTITTVMRIVLVGAGRVTARRLRLFALVLVWRTAAVPVGVGVGVGVRMARVRVRVGVRVGMRERMSGQHQLGRAPRKLKRAADNKRRNLKQTEEMENEPKKTQNGDDNTHTKAAKIRRKEENNSEQRKQKQTKTENRQTERTAPPHTPACLSVALQTWQGSIARHLPSACCRTHNDDDDDDKRCDNE